jgi:hypothetical protein
MVKGKRWQDELPPEALVRPRFRDARLNIAVIATGMVPFDVDAED